MPAGNRSVRGGAASFPLARDGFCRLDPTRGALVMDDSPKYSKEC